MRNIVTCVVDVLEVQKLRVEASLDLVRGIHLFDKVCGLIGLQERYFFGLCYIHPKDQKVSWLELDKKIRPQLREGPYCFYLRVRFYPPNLKTLLTDTARYLFVLQLRDDLICKRLLCDIEKAADLFSCIVQDNHKIVAEIGDYDRSTMGDSYLDDVEFLPDQKADFHIKVAGYHQSLRRLTLEEAELRFLQLATTAGMYGVVTHVVFDEDRRPLTIGVSAWGIYLLSGSKQLLKYRWAKLVSCSFIRKKIKLIILEDRDDLKTVLAGASLSVIAEKIDSERTKLVLRCPSCTQAKRVYNDIIAHHTFFRRQPDSSLMFERVSVSPTRLGGGTPDRALMFHQDTATNTRRGGETPDSGLTFDQDDASSTRRGGGILDRNYYNVRNVDALSRTERTVSFQINTYYSDNSTSVETISEDDEDGIEKELKFKSCLRTAKDSYADSEILDCDSQTSEIDVGINAYDVPYMFHNFIDPIYLNESEIQKNDFDKESSGSLVRASIRSLINYNIRTEESTERPMTDIDDSSSHFYEVIDNDIVDHPEKSSDRSHSVVERSSTVPFKRSTTVKRQSLHDRSRKVASVEQTGRC